MPLRAVIFALVWQWTPFMTLHRRQALYAERGYAAITIEGIATRARRR